MLPMVVALIISSGTLFVKMDEWLIVVGSAGQQPAPLIVVAKPVSATEQTARCRIRVGAEDLDLRLVALHPQRRIQTLEALQAIHQIKHVRIENGGILVFAAHLRDEFRGKVAPHIVGIIGQ